MRYFVFLYFSLIGCTLPFFSAHSKSTSQHELLFSGVTVLQAPLSADVDVLRFSKDAVLYTNGYAVTIHASQKLVIENQASIRGLTDADLSACAYSTVPIPLKAKDGYSWNPGPDTHGPGPGLPGRAGGPGAVGKGGLAYIAKNPTCRPRKIAAVTIDVAGSAEGLLNVYLPGARGAQVAPAGVGGNGGTGEQGGSCPPGNTGYPAGEGGQGGSGGQSNPANNANSSGDGGNFTLAIRGDASNFTLGTVDNFAGTPSFPGTSGAGGSGGKGGFFGRGGPGCIGLEKLPAFSGFRGATGLTKAISVGQIGKNGTLNLVGTSLQADDCPSTGPVSDDDAWSALQLFWTDLSKPLFGQDIEVIGHTGSKRDTLLVPHVSVQRLLKLPVIDTYGTIDQEIFQLVKNPPPASSPPSQCSANDLSCCITQLPNGTKVSSPFVECLDQFVPSRSPTAMAGSDRWTFVVLLKKIVAEEFARRSVLVDPKTISNESLQSGAIYLQLDSASSDGLWPGGMALMVKADSSLFDAVVYVLQRTASSLALTLFEAPYPLDTREDNYAVLCADGHAKLIDTHDGDFASRQGFSRIQSGSGRPLDVFGPTNLRPNPQFIGVSTMSYRDMSIVQPLVSNSSYVANDSEICRIASDIGVRSDKPMFCSGATAPPPLLVNLQEPLAAPEVQATFFDVTYISAFGASISDGLSVISSRASELEPSALKDFHKKTEP